MAEYIEAIDRLLARCRKPDDKQNVTPHFPPSMYENPNKKPFDKAAVDAKVESFRVTTSVKVADYVFVSSGDMNAVAIPPGPVLLIASGFNRTGLSNAGYTGSTCQVCQGARMVRTGVCETCQDCGNGTSCT